jgi:hypothetical protein
MCTLKKLPRLLIGNRTAYTSDLANFFLVFVVAVLIIRPSPWFACTKVIVSGAVDTRVNTFFCRDVL